MASKEGQTRLPAAAEKQKQHVSKPKVETHSSDDHQTAAAASTAAADAGSSKYLSPTAHSGAPAPQHSKPVLAKHGKAPAAAAAAAASPAQPAAGSRASSIPGLQPSVAAGGIGGKSGTSRSGSIKPHDSTTSRRLQALLASDELSSLNLLATEGSELPGRDWHVCLHRHKTVL